MSKWTLEKILACDEIRFGTRFEKDGHEYLVNNKALNSFSFFKKDMYTL